MATHAVGEKSISGPVIRSKNRKQLDHMTIRKAENGGHAIEHHFGGFQHEPETHVFSKDEGQEAHEHIEKHMGMKMAELPDDGEADEE